MGANIKMTQETADKILDRIERYLCATDIDTKQMLMIYARIVNIVNSEVD